MGNPKNFTAVLVMAAELSRRTDRLSDVERDVVRLQEKLKELTSEKQKLQEKILVATQRIPRDMVDWDEDKKAQVFDLAESLRPTSE